MSQANELAPASPARRTARFNPRRIRWLILLILVGPCAAIQAPLEVGRWKLAQALDARDQGRKDEAHAKLAEAMRWIPNSTEIHMQRMQWRLDDGDKKQALADADELLTPSQESYERLVLHSVFMQKWSQHAAAVEDWKKIDQLSQRSGTPSRAEASNGLAYVQAVAKVELDDALRHVEDALELVGDDADARAQFLDTRGYLRYLKGQYQLAHDDMNAAIETWERVQRERIKKLEEVRRKWRLSAEPPPKPAPPLAERHKRLLRPARFKSFTIPPTQAVLYYHRALVREALGKDTEAKQDRAVVRGLIGREPDETLY